jgi:isopenicillin-N epimerase
MTPRGEAVAPARASASGRPSGLRTGDGEPAASEWALDPTIRHLNHGSFGAVPRAALEFQAALRARTHANPCDWYTKLAAAVRSARTDVAGILGAPVGATAFVPNASGGASVAYGAVPARAGMDIVVTDHGYGAVLMGARRLARRWDGSMTSVHIPLDADDDEIVGRVVGAIGPATGLVVIDQVTSATARAFPAGRIAAECRRRGVPVLVDAAHAPGVLADPLAGIDADFWVGNLHKFACAPAGAAALVASGAHSDRLFPLIDSWGAEAPYPDRFDQQGTLDMTSFLAAPVAWDTIERRFGWATVRRHMDELGDYAQRTIAGAFADATGELIDVPTGMQVSGLRLVGLPARVATTPDEAGALRTELAERLGIETAITSWGGSGFLRISTHAYSTPEDYEDFAERAVPFVVERSRARLRD